jgi:LuxR family maltose regulon positive regulatory protein
VGVVDRPRVHALLDDAARHRVSIVSAGPGWGKTTSVAGWVASAHGQVTATAWVSLRAADNNLAAFWKSVHEAVSSTGLLGAGHPLAGVSLSGRVTDEVLHRLHDALRLLPAPLLLVLDDVQLIDDPAVIAVLSRVATLDTPLRLMLLSRADPLLPVHTLRLSGDLAELTTTDLAFDADEVAELAVSHGLRLTPADTEHLRRTTEGWPAGLRLACLQLSRETTVVDVTAFGGTTRSVADYLLAEVVDRTPPDVRDFLLRTSVVEQVSAGLAEAIVPHLSGQRTLEWLEGHNGFVTALGTDGQWFRYHTLLRDLLQHLLRRDDPLARAAAHRAAAGWLATHDDPVEGLEHAAMVEDWELFGSILTTAAGPYAVSARREALHRVLADIPFDRLPDTLTTRLLAATLALTSGELDAVTHHLAAIDAMVKNTDDDGPAAMRPDRRIVLEILRAVVARRAGDGRALVRASSAALQLLDDSDYFLARAGYRVIILNALGVGHLWLGETTDARECFTTLARLPDSVEVGMALLNARAQLSACELLDGHLDVAIDRAQRTLADAGRRGWTSLLQARPAHVTTATVRLLRGDVDGADRAVVEGLAADVGGTEPPPSLALRITQASIAVSRRRSRTAAQLAVVARDAARGWTPSAHLVDELARMTADVGLLTGDTASAHAVVRDLTTAHGISPALRSSEARLLLGSGDIRGAAAMAATVIDEADIGTYVDLVALVDAWIVTALSEHRRRKPFDELVALGRAVEVAAPQRLVRPFVVTDPDRMRTVLPTLVDWLGGATEFTDRLQTRLTATPGRAPGPDPMVEHLTQRELAILAALPSSKTNLELASDFYVSVNTIKTHIKALYRKLGVENRRQAVLRARELALIP